MLSLVWLQRQDGEKIAQSKRLKKATENKKAVEEIILVYSRVLEMTE